MMSSRWRSLSVVARSRCPLKVRYALGEIGMVRESPQCVAAPSADRRSWGWGGVGSAGAVQPALRAFRGESAGGEEVRYVPCQTMVLPPLTPMTWPVMYPASSLTRNAHAAAMSSARPTRRTGVVASAAADAWAEESAFLCATQHGSVDETGWNGVDGDASRTEFLSQGLGEAHDPCLCGRVVDHERISGLRAG